MKNIKISLIIFFMLFIFSAAIQYCYPIINVENVKENRTKTKWPSENLWAGVTKGAGYAMAVERFFSDNFPLRDLMLRCLGQFEYSVLGRSREVIIGKDGWLSDKKVLAEHLHQLDTVDDEQIKASIIQLKRLQNLLQSKRIEFLMVIVPMKPTIYSEKFPKRYVTRPEQTGLIRFQKALKNNDVPFIDVLNILNKQKDQTELFYKTDMHWNSAGVSYTAEAIINNLSSKFIGKNIWVENAVKSEIQFSGEELAAMPLLFKKSETTHVWASSNPGYTSRLVGDVESYFGTDRTRAVLPPSIMFGNSFMLQYPSVGYHAYFGESSRVLDYTLFSKALDFIKPEHKIFILQIYETQLLFHIMPAGSLGYWSGSASYWDKRISDLPLPIGFKYK